jgi:hypothetical protein
MKNFIWLLIFLLGSFVSFGQSQKTLIKSFNANVNEVTINIEGNKSVSTWDKLYVRVELIVKTNMRNELLEVLVKNGRYTLESNINGGKLFISIPNLQNKIKIGDVELVENFEIKIWLPNDDKLQNGVSL